MPPSFRSAYKIVGDCTIFADVYTPTALSSDRRQYPVALIIHGGAFVLGHSAMVSAVQVQDCQERGWIVVSLEHRLCPQVDILEGPITDCRDALEWVYDGGLDQELLKHDSTATFAVDCDRVVAIGTSSGGTLALALGFNVKRPVAAILDFYGATNFSDPFWSSPLSTEKAPNVPLEFINQVYAEKPVPIRGGVSLEGQAEEGKPPPLGPRPAFAFTHIANGTLMDVCFPSKEFQKIDACLNIHQDFPPTCIVHGSADTKVPIFLSRALQRALQKAEVKCEFVEVPSEEHTFVGKMKKGSKTWDLQRTGFDFLQVEITKNG